MATLSATRSPSSPSRGAHSAIAAIATSRPWWSPNLWGTASATRAAIPSRKAVDLAPVAASGAVMSSVGAISLARSFMTFSIEERASIYSLRRIVRHPHKT